MRSTAPPGRPSSRPTYVAAPYYTATAKLKIAPPEVMRAGLTVSPNIEVETGQTPTTGESDVYAVFTVSADPVYAGQQVQISSPQLEDRCGQGWRWEPNGGAAVSGVPPDDRRRRQYPRRRRERRLRLQGFILRLGSLDRHRRRPRRLTSHLHHDLQDQATVVEGEPPNAAPRAAKATVPVTLTLSPTPVTEIGFSASGDLSITKTDNDGGSSIAPDHRDSGARNIDHLHDRRLQLRTDHRDRSIGDRCAGPQP